MSVSMEDIKKLRAKTGAGFAICKEALEKHNNNFDEAVTHLQKIGMAEVAKRRGRSTSEGSIFTKIEGNIAVILELSCETDFVARNKDFVALGNDLATTILEKKPSSITDELRSKVERTIATIKENMELRRFQIIEKKESEIFAHYTHGAPAKLGTIVILSVENGDANTELIKKFAHNTALHAVAKLPLFLTKDSVDETYKNSQLEIFREQAAQTGKSGDIAEKIVMGKWNKLLNEVCFIQQPWVFDEKSTVAKELETIQKESGATITISQFLIYTLGSD